MLRNFKNKIHDEGTARSGLPFVFSPKVTQKQTTFMTQASAGSREWVTVVSDKPIINGFACLVSFQSGRE